MKPVSALILSLFAGIGTFAGQHYFFPAQLHAAPFVVPQTADWRQQMIDQDPGGAIVDRRLEHLTDKLDLTVDQAAKFRPLIEKEHRQILSVLLTAPASLTRAQFLERRAVIREQTHRQLDALLSPDQQELLKVTEPRSAG